MSEEQTERLLRQAKIILDLNAQVKGLQRAAQEKEDYIADLIESHHKVVTDLNDKLVTERMRASVAEAKLARLSVGMEDD